MIPCDELGVHDDDLHVLQTVGRAPDADVAAGTLEHRVMRRGQPLAQIGNDPLLYVAWCLANACATEWSVNEYDPTRIDVGGIDQRDRSRLGIKIGCGVGR